MTEPRPVPPPSPESVSSGISSDSFVGPPTPTTDSSPLGNDPTAGPILVEVSEIPYGVPLRIPRRGGSEFETRLADANSTARASALDRLAKRFPGYDFALEAQNVDDRRFVALEIGNALLDELATVDAVERLLTRDHLWGIGGVSFSHAGIEGHQPPPREAVIGPPAVTGERGWLDIGGLARAFADEWTAIINGAHRFDPALAHVCADLSSAYGARTNTNIYISDAQAKGFGAHWDTHDTIIVAVHGRKQWNIYEPGWLSAQRPWVDGKVSDKPLWSGELIPGGALVIPRGWGHEVEHCDDLSIHCTIGIARLEVHQVFERVAFEAGFSANMRADFPFDVRAEVHSYSGSVFDDPNGLSREAATMLTPELVERASATYRARVTETTFPSLLQTVRATRDDDWTDTGVRLPAPGGVMLAEENDDSTIVAYGNRAVRLANQAVDAFALLASGTPVAPTQLPPVMVDGEDQRARFASQLVRCGAAVVEPRSARPTP